MSSYLSEFARQRSSGEKTNEEEAGIEGMDSTSSEEENELCEKADAGDSWAKHFFVKRDTVYSCLLAPEIVNDVNCGEHHKAFSAKGGSSNLKRHLKGLHHVKALRNFEESRQDGISVAEAANAQSSFQRSRGRSREYHSVMGIDRPTTPVTRFFCKSSCCSHGSLLKVCHSTPWTTVFF